MTEKTAASPAGRLTRIVRTTAVVIGVGAALAGCTSAPDWQRQPEEVAPAGARYEGASLTPGLMEVSPRQAQPGKEVTITFADEMYRGREYSLEQSDGDGWQWRFSLSSGERSNEPTWWYPLAEYAITDDTYSSTTVRVPVPEPAEPGDYRICTSEGTCAPLIVAGG